MAVRGIINPYDVTPEDLALDYLWGSRFRNAYDEVAKGGEIEGNPIINKKIILGGINDYGRYKLNNQFYIGLDKYSFHILFNPNTPYNEDADTYLFCDQVLSYVRKRDNANGDVLRIQINGTLIEQIPSATYGPLWRVGGWNLLSFSGESANNDCWFNGEEMFTDDVSAWTMTASATFIDIGQRNPDLGRLNGKVDLIKFYSRLIPEIEHRNLWKAIGAMI